MFASKANRAKRRGWPIIGYVGPNGSGKSAAAVWDLIPSLEAGRPVLSTVRILDYEQPRECEGCDSEHHQQPVFETVPIPEGMTRMQWLRATTIEDRRRVVGHRVHMQAHPLWVPFTRWEQLLEARGTDVLMDEVTGVASSRESHGMPAPVANALVQMRRADVTIRWTAPSWARADKIIRETSQAVTDCVGYFPKVIQLGDEESERMWRSRRLFKWRTYDATQFEDWTAGKRDQARALVSDLHWGPGSGVWQTYDTFDSVLTIGTVTEAGTCYRCGGTRRRPACSCSDETASEARPARGPRLRGASGRARTPSVATGQQAPEDHEAPVQDSPSVPSLVEYDHFYVGKHSDA